MNKEEILILITCILFIFCFVGLPALLNAIVTIL